MIIEIRAAALAAVAKAGHVTTAGAQSVCMAAGQWAERRRGGRLPASARAGMAITWNPHGTAASPGPGGGGMPDRPTAGPRCRTAAATAAAREQQAAAAARAGTARADRRADSQQSATWWWSGHAAAMRRRLHMTVGHRRTDTSRHDRTGAHAPPSALVQRVPRVPQWPCRGPLRSPPSPAAVRIASCQPTQRGRMGLTSTVAGRAVIPVGKSGEGQPHHARGAMHQGARPSYPYGSSRV